MPITELALLRLQSDTSPSDQTLVANLRRAKDTMESFTGNTFYYYTQVEDSSLIYIIGSWASAEQHFHQFIPSPANQSLLASLKDQLTVEWMFHINLNQQDIPLAAPVIAIGRHFIRPEERAGFTETFNAVRPHLDDFTKPKKVAGGWRAEEEEDKNEWVLFTGWDEVAQHGNFGESEGFKEYARIRDFLDGAEIKHAVRWDL